MNSDNLTDWLQKSFHITLGATATLVESLQDAQKRDENMGKLQLEWSQLSQEWAEKGAVTEQEARSFVDNLFASQNPSGSADGSSTSGNTSTTPTAPPDVQSEIQDLTAQIAALRTELEQLRNSSSSK